MSRSIAVAYSMARKRNRKASGGEVKSGDKEMDYSKGGEVNENKIYGRGDESKQKGVHKTNYKGYGNSAAGSFAKSAASGNTSVPKDKLNSYSKEEHEKVLGELKSMKGPHGNYAEGGEVDKDPVVEKTPDQAGAGPVSPEESKKFAQGMCPSCGYSEGGMVANDTGEGTSADKSPNEFDDLVLRDGLEFSLDGKNSGDELGGPSKMDLVSRAMLKRKKK